jgi:hypothetical protein
MVLMAPEGRAAVEDRYRRVRYTVDLTEALDAGDITPSEYVRLRASVVGQGDIFQSLLIPLFKQIFLKIRNMLTGER